MGHFSARVFAGVGYFVNPSGSGDFQIIFNIREEYLHIQENTLHMIVTFFKLKERFNLNSIVQRNE